MYRPDCLIHEDTLVLVHMDVIRSHIVLLTRMEEEITWDSKSTFAVLQKACTFTCNMFVRPLM